MKPNISRYSSHESWESSQVTKEESGHFQVMHVVLRVKS